MTAVERKDTGGLTEYRLEQQEQRSQRVEEKLDRLTDAVNTVQTDLRLMAQRIGSLPCSGDNECESPSRARPAMYGAAAGGGALGIVELARWLFYHFRG